MTFFLWRMFHLQTGQRSADPCTLDST